ncbi:MAG: GNAT family N-acetyltransferase, partial [Methylocystis sp.]
FYDEAQRAAWAARAEDEAAFAAKLAQGLTVVALVEKEIAGFATLEKNETVEMLYVHPDFARQGVGATLLGALEKLAAARGTTTLEVEASDAARDFFAKRGFTAQSRNTVEINGEWLGRTRMTKALVKIEVDPRLVAAAGRPQ